MSKYVKLEYTANVTETGEMKLEKRSQFLQDIKIFANQKVSVVVTKCRSIRSTEQNNLYWVWLSYISKQFIEFGHSGMTAEKLHYVFKRKYLKHLSDAVCDTDGVVIDTVPPSTTRLSKSEFSDYMEKIELYANGELQIQLPTLIKN